jgi:hypothetical protein
LIILVICLAAMSFVGLDLVFRVRGDHAQRAVHAAIGYDRARAIDDADAEDAALADDEEVAGAMWAAHHPQALPQECPHYNAAFHMGCTAALALRVDAGAVKLGPRPKR